MSSLARVFCVVLLAELLFSGCAPTAYKYGTQSLEPSIIGDKLIVADGTQLPIRKWAPKKGKLNAVLLAIHGFNDYSNYFKPSGEYLAEKYGVISYAIDQRGFGLAPPKRGIWAGVKTYAGDVKSAVVAIKKLYPSLPFFMLGTSMGGGVVMIAMTDKDKPNVDGIVLLAPAVWGRETMPWFQRLALWVGAHTFPDITLTGKGLKIKPSDNIPMLIEFGKDPLVIKETKIGTIYGLTNLMDLALQRAQQLSTPALILYGNNDEVIPKAPTALMLSRLPNIGLGTRRIGLYKKGYHMLLRDLQRKIVWDDIGAWITDGGSPLPSGADQGDLSTLSGKG
jgi:acylglycerol lipase